MKVLVKVLKGERNLHSYLPQTQANPVKVFPANKNLHRILRLIVKVVTVVKVLQGIEEGKRFCLTPVIVERKCRKSLDHINLTVWLEACHPCHLCQRHPEITVMARLAHLARIISHGPEIMATDHGAPIPSAGRITGSRGIATGSADNAIQNFRERNYLRWEDKGVVTPLPL